MRVYKLYAAISSTGTNLATVTMVRPGRIRSIRWASGADVSADNSYSDVELSFQAVSNVNVNDTTGSIDELRSQSNFTTSGQMQGAIHKQSLVDIPVSAGDRLYLNATNSGTHSARVTCFVDVAD